MNGWINVHDAKVLCPVCGKNDWCLVHVEGKKVICPRTKSNMKMAKSGWLHKVFDNGLLTKTIKEQKHQSNLCVNWVRLARQYHRRGSHHIPKMALLGMDLQIRYDRLQSIWRVGWDGEAYTIPCYNGQFQMTGIMRRFPDGKKIWVSRSRNGLFLPKLKSWIGNLFICEGWTDAACLVQLGFRAIGRANCQTGEKGIKDLLRCRPDIQQVTVIADNDDMGKRGAKDLLGSLGHRIPTAMLTVPKQHKDMRQWCQGGATREQVILRSKRL